MLEEDLLADPVQQFERWFEEARSSGVAQPEAMALATSSAAGSSVRFVLLKGVDQRGFVFFTNYESRKGRDLTGDGAAGLAFHWQLLGRQVRVTGRVERTSREESLAYFQSRPRGSQIAAAVSAQSRPVGSRAELESAYARLQAEVGEGPVPLPAHWGGYRLRPETVEFWEHRDDRLHDRLLYTRTPAGWRRERLQP